MIDHFQQVLFVLRGGGWGDIGRLKNNNKSKHLGYVPIKAPNIFIKPVAEKEQ